jgi:hypothetical protein
MKDLAAAVLGTQLSPVFRILEGFIDHRISDSNQNLVSNQPISISVNGLVSEKINLFTEILP